MQIAGGYETVSTALSRWIRTPVYSDKSRDWYFFCVSTLDPYPLPKEALAVYYHQHSGESPIFANIVQTLCATAKPLCVSYHQAPV